RHLNARRLQEASREGQRRARSSAPGRLAKSRQFLCADGANAAGSARREALRRAEEPTACGQATKRWASKGGAEENRGKTGKRERWSPSEQRRKEGIQRRESVKCGLVFPENGRGL